ncbi:putative membrane protein [Sulfuritortus calidifontis]|uniref:Putative membrane protein n=1 Tax=Sulfuritortus calidifontis TaxID=1914471 RepID=A0A4R3K0X8_9PROT|nr:DUF2069 domain-containing protein [Sulfuritortus calidifontis]TCS74049.1 putative membrane protein [Sulfuritortus calidifontis]
MQNLRTVTHWLSIASLIALIGLCLAWELWLAPLRPGGSWLALKALPLLAPLFGILRGRLYTYKWSSLLIWLYFTEATVRAWSDTGLSARLALAELVLSLLFLVSAVLFIRASRALSQQKI